MWCLTRRGAIGLSMAFGFRKEKDGKNEEKTVRIGFIGAGRMAGAMIDGLIEQHVYDRDEIIACAPTKETRDRMCQHAGISMYEKASEIAPLTDVIVIACKPKNIPPLFTEEGFSVGPGTLLISIAAGVKIETLQGYAPGAKIVRAMPNHCCMVLEGAMGYACDPSLGEGEREQVARMLEAVGMAVEVPESDMDAITGIAGSSPAFMYMVIDAMADAGVLNGLSRADSIRLAAQSMLGAAKMVLETGKHPDQLKDEVCSPAGTTIVGVRTLEDGGLRSSVIAAVDETIARSRSMSRE